ncbi:hypothetical protein EB001_00420 [bacterium]|nr:hypothetical protein [bacterium]
MIDETHWENAPDRVQDKFIESAFLDLVDRGFIPLMDEPMEETPGFETAYEMAIERFNEKYPNGFFENE